MDLPERIYFQYRSKPKAVAWFNMPETIGDELIEAFGAIRDSYDIETATGAQLDIIAAIVGVDRSLTRGKVLNVHQFSNDGIEEEQFSNDGVEEVQFSAGSIDDDTELDDEYLRRMILWKIAGNNSSATIEDTLHALQIVMPHLTATVDDPEDMTFSLVFVGEGPDDIDALILSLKDVVPRPQGVRFDGYSVDGVFFNGYQ